MSHLSRINLLCICIVTAFLCAYTPASLPIPSPPIYSEIQIDLSSPEAVEKFHTIPLAHDCGAHHDLNKKTMQLVVNQTELKMLQAQQIPYNIIHNDASAFYTKRLKEQTFNKKSAIDIACDFTNYPVPENFEYGSMGGFLTYEEIIGHLDNMHQLYPHLITAKAPVGEFETYEGRPIYWLRLSDNAAVDEADEPEVLYTAVHHAREPMSVFQLIYFMYYLLENYETDAEVKALVDSRELYFMPCVNPDGYIYNETTNPNGGGYWRKNRRPHDDGEYGVDLNRNYGFKWALNDTGSSDDTYSDVYRGEAPFSEPETQAIRALCASHDFKIAFNNHSYSNLLIYPWGHEIGAYTEDDDLFQMLATRMTAHSSYRYGNGWDAIRYLVNGEADDWMYGEQTEKNKIFPFTPEVGSRIDDGFWPEQDRIIPLCQQMMLANLEAARLSGAFGIVEPQSSYALSSQAETIQFNYTHLGLQDSILVQVTFEPISDKIISPTRTIIVNNLATLEQQLLDYQLELSNTIQAEDKLTLKIKLDFGDTDAEQFFDFVYQPTVVFEDDFENGSQWEGNWFVSPEAAHSGSFCLTDTPNDTYTDEYYAAIYSPTIDLRNAEEATLTFWAKWDIGNSYDAVYLNVLADENTPQCGQYTAPGSEWQRERLPCYDGKQNEWVQEKIDLSAYVGQEIQINFEIETQNDEFEIHDGFFIDDLKVYTRNKMGLHFQSKVFLQGAYDATTGAMRHDLQTRELIPEKQPYNNAPWNYTGNETYQIPSSYAYPIVDWILLELREVSQPTVVVEQIAALLRNDGVIVDMYGQEGVSFQQTKRTGEYYVVIRHRNHLAIMSDTPVQISQTNTYDFTTSIEQANGSDQLIEVGGMPTMRTGDTNSEGTVTVADLNYYLTVSGGVSTYNNADCNLDGVVTIEDFNQLQRNSGALTVNLLRY